MEKKAPTFTLVDVFGRQKYGGGPLAVFTNCENLTTEEMQGIAHEINFPETTFITSEKPIEGGFNVRIFTPKSEIDFAGHPTLGTAYIIKKYLKSDDNQTVKLNLKVGQIPVDFDKNILWMKQVEPEFREELDSSLLARTLGLDQEDFDPAFPIEGVSTGLPFTIVPLRNEQALNLANININVYNNEFINKATSKGILIFCLSDQSDESLRTRVFVNYLGIPEDPATGSASGCLAGYLVKHRYFSTNKIDIKIGQGYQVSRPSCIFLKASLEDSLYEIFVGGTVIENACGTWKV